MHKPAVRVPAGFLFSLMPDHAVEVIRLPPRHSSLESDS